MSGPAGQGSSGPDLPRDQPAGVPAARNAVPSPRLPRLLAALCDRLPEDRIMVVEQVLASVTAPDDLLLSRFIAAQSAAGLARQLTEIVRVWSAEAPGMTGASLGLALATVRAFPRPRPAQVAVSGPMSASLPARLTSGVAVEVIRSARTSLLVVSFAAHGARNVVAEIGQAVERGVRVDLLLEESTQAATAFVALPSEVNVWHRVGPSGVLHAKLIVADRHTALLGSANLTDRALSDNIELGVVLRDPSLVEPLVEHFRWLLSPENDIMRPA
ncbi:DISARM system phospholipase D-like protein DrmC [Streptomyces sp. SAI-127]|uniref:DISARM system phospholipase D-like protein DrmC n=1 Tax=Streptomyces sp. SAI-127 TaxID=2940543 RepID=UPI0024750C41|nr:DISARM system phospholipase D-like protein DrmC [Streptomyces sp. SAI-127]MDH6488715.1 phosphatidylserine/phosphatidylglycerophosphate/cardiolipin synthase-like enzyme [Streptomyces sp. SAI-127]